MVGENLKDVCKCLSDINHKCYMYLNCLLCELSVFGMYKLIADFIKDYKMIKCVDYFYEIYH